MNPKVLDLEAASVFFFFFFQRLAPGLTTVANLFFLFLLLSPQTPLYTVVYLSCMCFWLWHVGRHLNVA